MFDEFVSPYLVRKRNHFKELVNKLIGNKGILFDHDNHTHIEHMNIYGEGTLVRGSTGLHTQCGSDVRPASPSGDRATTAQRRNLE